MIDLRCGDCLEMIEDIYNQYGKENIIVVKRYRQIAEGVYPAYHVRREKLILAPAVAPVKLRIESIGERASPYAFQAQRVESRREQQLPKLALVALVKGLSFVEKLFVRRGAVGIAFAQVEKHHVAMTFLNFFVY